MAKPAIRGLFITGTDTEVGKTAIGASLAGALYQSGIDVQPRKPVESGCPSVDGRLMPQDGLAYYQATHQSVPLEIITPYRYAALLAPPQAAELVGEKITLDQLQSAVLDNLSDDSFCLTEGAGGFYSPTAVDGLNADLAATLSLPILIVASDKLGCVNHVLLTLEAAKRRKLNVVSIVLNKTMQSMAQDQLDNFSLLSKHTSIPLIQTAFNETLSVDVSELVGLLEKANAI